MKDHAGESIHNQAVPKRSVIGIGGYQHYTIYDPATDQLEFHSAERSGRGIA